jgi:hypothetical protein
VLHLGRAFSTAPICGAEGAFQQFLRFAGRSGCIRIQSKRCRKSVWEIRPAEALREFFEKSQLERWFGCILVSALTSTAPTEMASSEISELIPAPSSVVFDLLHDYARRLEWDTLLQAAYLQDGASAAAKGVTAVCVGRKSLGGFFNRGQPLSGMKMFHRASRD